ncbi:TetR family transcriptional regulator [Alcaligenaceae bacterium CGII-47]|nr:TetR family transcriptional regulator [Alcaligenaceae bacterium CGII-47]
MATPRSASTRDAILDAAERLFAEYGPDNTSMRQITSTAQVNLSAVNYHFGSKDTLVQAVFQRRLDALNTERIEILDRLETAATDQRVDPSAIIEAYFGPLVRHACKADAQRRAFMPLQSLTMSDPNGALRALFAAERNVVAQRFTRSLLRSLPTIPEADIVWRFHFMLGATAYAIMRAERSGRAIDQADDEASPRPQDLLDRLIPFLLGGLCAPSPRGVTGNAFEPTIATSTSGTPP